jgi:hypothetical protein
MVNPEKLATLGTQDTSRKQTTQTQDTRAKHLLVFLVSCVCLVDNDCLA